MDQCSFCDRPRNEVKSLVEAQKKGLFICNRCVGTASESLGQQASAPMKDSGVLQKPQEIKEYLDEYVISQEHAKKDVAVAVYNHYKRREAARKGMRFDVDIQKSNILLLGPTGTGKTQLARSLARKLGVPFYVGDATRLTQAGYMGDDVESLIQGLIVNSEGDVERAQWGIIYLDEADKMARKSGRNVSGFRDVSGEGVQQAILKIVEGAKIQVPLGPRGTGETVMVDTENILFILAGSFADIENIVKERVNKSAKMGFGSTAKRDLKDSDVYLEIEEADILEFGIIPELLGRVPIHTSTLPLTEEEMVRILTEPKDALVKQFKALFSIDGIDLQFDTEALLEIGREAKSHPTGARALRSILEKVLKKYAYECPSDPTIKSLLISKEVVLGKAEAIIGREPVKIAATA